MVIVVDLVDRPVGAAPCRLESGEFALEGTPDSVGVVKSAPSMNSTIAAAVPSVSRSELALGRSGDVEFVRAGVLGHLVEVRARSSSPVM